MKLLNCLVVGAGMYVCGRGTDGFGTIMPALFEQGRSGALGDIFVAGTSPANIKKSKLKIGALLRLMGVKARLRYYPADGRIDSHAYRKAFRDIRRPSCAFVCVPDHLRTAVAADAMNAGLHTFVVKPLAPSLKEVKALIKVRETNNVYGAVDFHKRWDEANIKLKGIIAEGRLGEPLYMIVEYSQRKSVPGRRFIKWVSKTNIFQYLGIHYVDIINFTTGAIPVRAMATGQKLWLRSKGIDAYDAIQAVIEWKLPSGKRFISHILTNWIDPESTSAMSDQRIKVIGTKGRFESDQKNRGITIVSDEGGIEEPNPYFSSPYGTTGALEYKGYGIRSIRRFLDDVTRIEKGDTAISELENDRPTFGQSIIPTAVIEAVGRSLRNEGAWVKVKP